MSIELEHDRLESFDNELNRKRRSIPKRTEHRTGLLSIVRHELC